MAIPTNSSLRGGAQTLAAAYYRAARVQAPRKQRRTSGDHNSRI
jgi:hypothetical protein